VKINLADAAALAAVMEKDLDAISQIEAHAAQLPEADLNREQLDSLGFALHNVYNALENSFTQVSLTFENHVKDRSRWHRELLEKMLLDVPPLRPRVLAPESRALLADLLGFRHLFRHAYEAILDEDKTLALWQRWRAEGARIKDALRAFARELTKTAAGADV
jgi:hypothetical protein